MKRNIVKIDESLCNGCGQCVSACAEGAIRIINGKAKLVSDSYCDGLGACLGECPQGAIAIEEREAADLDEKAALAQHTQSQHPPVQRPAAQYVAVQVPAVQRPAQHPAATEPAAGGFHAPMPGGCPGMQARVLRSKAARPASFGGGASTTSTTSIATAAQPSVLAQWPVQLHLVSPQAPYFADCDLLVAADCVAFAMGDFHEKLLAGRAVAIACPKLDDVAPYAQKLAAIFSHNNVRHVTVAIMEVPCCRGLMSLVSQALEVSGKDIPLTLKVIGLEGQVKFEETRAGVSSLQ